MRNTTGFLINSHHLFVIHYLANGCSAGEWSISTVCQQWFTRQAILDYCACNVAEAPVAEEFAIGFEYGNNIEIKFILQVIFENIEP